jgi:hypothetical protein
VIGFVASGPIFGSSRYSDLFQQNPAICCRILPPSNEAESSHRQSAGRCRSGALENSELTLQELLLPAMKHLLVRIIPVKQFENPSDDTARDHFRIGPKL